MGDLFENGEFTKKGQPIDVDASLLPGNNADKHEWYFRGETFKVVESIGISYPKPVPKYIVCIWRSINEYNPVLNQR